MEIVKYGHPALRWKSVPITKINQQLRDYVSEMFELMYEAKGIGLAANQVALPYRFFVVNITSDPEEKDEEFVFLNPEIVKRKGVVEGEEGCLSLPEVYGQVRRSEEIVVEAFDLDGNGFEMQLKDLPARVVQHETDHLNGVLFPDHLSEGARSEIDPQLEDFLQTFRSQQSSGDLPNNEQLKQQLQELQSQQS
ncbi:MAG: peptide deformylase [Planctomycetaceae bacterium]|nr:peptide deformylase [Planctomycetaceae bacterium]